MPGYGNGPQNDTPDPLGFAKAPSAFDANTPVGTKITMILEGPLTQTQQRDINDTSKLLTWPDGNPKMSVVARGQVDGELKSFWAKKPGSMFRAFQDAQEKAGVRMAAGGKLEVAFVGTQKNPEKPRLSPQKLYKARYTPPVADDALAGDGGQADGVEADPFK